MPAQTPYPSDKIAASSRQEPPDVFPSETRRPERDGRSSNLSRRGEPDLTMFLLAHLSDLHLGPLPAVTWKDLASKRVLGYMNWHRSRGRRVEVDRLSVVTQDIRAAGPDHIAVTGDLVNLGLDAEIVAARRWLDHLGEPDRVSVVPGNHDAYIPGAVKRILHAWHPFMCGDTEAASPTGFPYLRRRGPIGIVGVSTAVATAPFMATGRITHRQADAVAALLDDLGREGLFRVVLIHHPPQPRASDWHRRLIGAEHFRRAVARSGAELVLHGHNHRPSVSTIPGPNHPVPVVGAASASLGHRGNIHAASYMLFRISRSHGRFVCDMTERGVSAATRLIETRHEVRLLGR